ncbi:leucine-rich repeat-containing protein [Pycnococcus provasolii]
MADDSEEQQQQQEEVNNESEHESQQQQPEPEAVDALVVERDDEPDAAAPPPPQPQQQPQPISIPTINDEVAPPPPRPQNQSQNPHIRTVDSIVTPSRGGSTYNFSLTQMATVSIHLDDSHLQPQKSKKKKLHQMRNSVVARRAQLLPLSHGGPLQDQLELRGGSLSPTKATAKAQDASSSPTAKENSSSVTQNSLDGFVLLGVSYADLPEEVESASLTSQNLTDVTAEDMAFFTSLRILDLGDNHLHRAQTPPLLALAHLPAVETLVLACNALTTLVPPEVELTPQQFAHLTLLDLSYNHVTSTSLASLAHLPKLAQLLLRGNGLSTLELIKPSEASTNMWLSLTHLDVADNNLKPTALLHILRLPALEKLILDRNPIPYTPNLTAVATSTVAMLSMLECPISTEEDFLSVRSLHWLTKMKLHGTPVSRVVSAGGARRFELPRIPAGVDDENFDVSTAPIIVLFDDDDAPPPKPTVTDVLMRPEAKAILGREARLFPPDESLNFGTGYAKSGGAKPTEMHESAAARLKAVFDALEESVLGTTSEEVAPAPAPDVGDDSDVNLLLDGDYDDDIVDAEEEEEEFDENDDSPWLRMSGFERSNHALPGGDATAALNALKFALAHPLSNMPENLSGASRPSWARDTELSTMRRDTVMSELVTRRRAMLADAPPNEAAARADGVRNIEKMLADMRERLADVERGLLERRARDKMGTPTAGSASAGAQPSLS